MSKGQRVSKYRMWWHVPSVEDWYNAGTEAGDAKKRRLGHIEVLSRRVTPPAVVTGQVRIGGTEVRGRHCDRRTAGDASLAIALHFEAGPACLTVAIECRAQCYCACSIAVSEYVAIATRTTCSTQQLFTTSASHRYSDQAPNQSILQYHTLL